MFVLKINKKLMNFIKNVFIFLKLNEKKFNIYKKIDTFTSHNPKIMKTFLPLVLILISAFFTNAQQHINLQAERSEFTISQNTGLTFESTFSFTELEFHQVRTPLGIFAEMHIPDFTFRYNDGNPSIPVYSKLVEIPGNASVNIKILKFDTQIINLADYAVYERIIPAQPSYSKSTDPDDIEFVFNEAAYLVNDFTQGPIASIEYQGKARGAGIAQLIIDPVRYNPVTNQLMIFNNIEFSVEYATPSYSEYLEEKSRVYSPMFSSLYHKLPNFIPPANKDLISQYPIKYVIVSDPMFQDSLQKFVQWKTQKGFHVVEAYTNNPAVGTTTTSIKAYLQGLYNAGTPTDPAPTFVLFVGDVAQIPVFSGTAGSHPTDLYYAEYDGGTDFIPELYYGRFSATSIAQLMPQINKTLKYEKFTLPSTTYMDTVVMVSGVDGTYAITHGNGQINYGNNNYFNSANGIYSHTYLYPLSSESWVDADVRAKVSAGAGYANYTAHCNSAGWGDPSFTTSHVPLMTNINKYGLMVGNCCLSNKFNDSECFGEALLRVADKGAVGYLGGSNSTYWNEDFYWGVGYTSSISANPTYAGTGLGAYDKLFHDHGEPYSDWFVTNGQMNYAGNTAVQASTSSLKKYYWEIYHLMGDPSVMNYLWNPDPLVMSYNVPLMVGDQSLVVQCEPYTLVALSLNNLLLDSKFSGPNNSVTLQFQTLTNTGMALIVGTKQNRAPHIQSIEIDEISVPVDAQVLQIANIEDSYTCVNVNIQPEVVIRNKGINNLTQLTLNYKWNSGAIQQISWTGNLTTMDTAHILLPAYLLTAGNHQLMVYSTNPNGSIDGNTSNDTILFSTTAQSLPVVSDFSANPTASCNLPATIDFTNLSQNALTYLWDFGDGTTSTDNSPSHTYISNGIFSVTLIADAGICGSDQKTYTNMIQIGNVPPAADFSANNLTPILGETVTFTDLSDCTPTSWSWSFDPAAHVTYMNGTSSSSQNPQVSFTQTGLYTITLTATNGFGSDVIVKTNYIHVISCTYCTTSFSNTSDEWISNVTFNTINNNSNSTNYSDFTGISTEVSPGSSYNASVTISVNGSYTEYCNIYIDWNQNCVFESGEIYSLGQTNGTGTLTSSINVPLNALYGPTRMRVSMRYSQAPTGCDQTTYGEAEDYTIQVMSLTSCLPPSGFIEQNITQSSADIIWTESGTATAWELEWGIDGFSPGNGTLVSITNNPTYQLTGLNPNTEYDYYVRAICSIGDESNWVGPVSFMTLCGIISTFPFQESFDGTIFAPACWTNIQTTGSSSPGTWDRQTNGSSPSCTPHSGSGMARYNSYSYYSGTQGILITPTLEFTHDQFEVSFWMYRDNGYPSNADLVNVYVNNSNNLIGATLMGTINRSTTLSPQESTNGWYQYTFNLPTGTSGLSYILFEGSSAYGNNMFIDDLVVTELAQPCSDPVALTANTTSATEAVLSWTETGIANTWDVEVGISGFTPTGTPTVQVTENPYSISGLTPNSTYDFYVRAVCSPGDESNWSGPVTFETSTKELHINVLLEGLYSGSGMMLPAQNNSGSQFSNNIADVVTIELYDAVQTNIMHYQNTNVMLEINGLAVLNDIPVSFQESYYIVIKHRNSIETWSSSPISFTGSGTVTYSFTNNSVQAYGQNLKAVSDGYYAVFSGDPNQDGIVDGTDLMEIDNASTLLLSGYVGQDLNGDGIVDATDMSLSENNSTIHVQIHKP